MKVRRVDLGREGDIDLLLPQRNCFIMFLVSYETLDGYMKIIKIKSARCPKNVIFAHAQNFQSILIC